VTVNASGATLETLAADGASAFGLRPWLIVADEFAAWPESPNAKRVWEAVISAVPKVPGSRFVVITSAGSPSHWSYKVLEHARESRLWRVSEFVGATPWLEPELLSELKGTLPASSYARLVLNEWTEAEDRLTTIDDLRACVTHSGPLQREPGRRYVMALDMAYVHDQAVAAICHRDSNGRVVLDRMEVWRGSRERPVQEVVVEAWIVSACSAYGRPLLVLDPWQTRGLAQRLRKGGQRVNEFTFGSQSVGRIALTLYRLIRDHAIALPDDEELLEELASVRLRETAPGVYRLDHDYGRHDDRAIAVALCAEALLSMPPSRRLRGYTAADVQIDGIRPDRYQPGMMHGPSWAH
jgi:phage terminase large subunit-like protein